MAVTLSIDVAVSELTPSGKLKDVDELTLAADRLQVVSVEVGGTWVDLAAWREAGSPRYDRARLQVVMTSGLAPMTAKHVATLARACQSQLDHFSAAVAGR